MKFDSVLLVTGEHETKVGMKYFREMVPMIKQRFNYLAMEVQPLDRIFDRLPDIRALTRN